MTGLGLSGGGKHINACRQEFASLTSNIIKLASLQVRACTWCTLCCACACLHTLCVSPNGAQQTAFVTLDEAIKLTNRRVNALDNVCA